MASIASYGPVKEPRLVLIFGDTSESRLVALKCMLLKCGLINFDSGRHDECGRCANVRCARAGLFIISRDLLNPREIESISEEARRLAVPVLHL